MNTAVNRPKPTPWQYLRWLGKRVGLTLVKAAIYAAVFGAVALIAGVLVWGVWCHPTATAIAVMAYWIALKEGWLPKWLT